MAPASTTIRPPPQLNPFYIDDALEDDYLSDDDDDDNDNHEIESLLVEDSSRLAATHKRSSFGRAPNANKRQSAQSSSFRCRMISCLLFIILIAVVWLFHFQDAAADSESNNNPVRNHTTTDWSNDRNDSTTIQPTHDNRTKPTPTRPKDRPKDRIHNSTRPKDRNRNKTRYY